MRNIEKYKDEILNEYQQPMNKNTPIYSDGTRMNKAIKAIAFKHCGKLLHGASSSLEWLCEEYKEPVLDDVEKAYLRAVIKPFKDKITFICKCELKENRCYIRIIVSSAVLPSGLDSIYFPIFIGDTMYKGMKANKCYSLKELGL